MTRRPNRLHPAPHQRVFTTVEDDGTVSHWVFGYGTYNPEGDYYSNGRYLETFVDGCGVMSEIRLPNPYNGDAGVITCINLETNEVFHEDNGRREISEYDAVHWVRVYKKLGINVRDVQGHLEMDIGL